MEDFSQSNQLTAALVAAPGSALSTQFSYSDPLDSNIYQSFISASISTEPSTSGTTDQPAVPQENGEFVEQKPPIPDPNGILYDSLTAALASSSSMSDPSYYYTNNQMMPYNQIEQNPMFSSTDFSQPQFSGYWPNNDFTPPFAQFAAQQMFINNSAYASAAAAAAAIHFPGRER